VCDRILIFKYLNYFKALRCSIRNFSLTQGIVEALSRIEKETVVGNRTHWRLFFHRHV
jgi:hypothetical protein